MSIHVLSLCVTAVIAYDNTVWVHNRCYPELEQLPHLVADYFTRNQEVYEAMDYERRVRFSAVLTTDYEYYWLRLGRAFASIGDLEQWYVDVSV